VPIEERIDRVRDALNRGAYEAEDGDVIVFDVDPSHVPLLKADRHKWGQGLVHQIDEERDQTVCGKSPSSCPGAKFYGPPDQITCKTCLRSNASRAEMEARRQEYEQINANHFERLRRNQAESKQRWWDDYTVYLQSPEWRAKRDKVMRRANGMCEGCGDRRAVQVHHLRYPQGCRPGSPEWLAQEKLFDLRAICVDCHEDVHPRARSNAAE
jgi:hypothetical protein